KIVTITSGLAGYPIVPFILLSFVARGMRFYLVAFLIYRYGERARKIIEERLEFWATAAFIVLGVGIIAAVYLFLPFGTGGDLNFATRRTEDLVLCPDGDRARATSCHRVDMGGHSNKGRRSIFRGMCVRLAALTVVVLTAGSVLAQDTQPPPEPEPQP